MPWHCALSEWNGSSGVAAFLRAILVVPLSLTNVGRETRKFPAGTMSHAGTNGQIRADRYETSSKRIGTGRQTSILRAGPLNSKAQQPRLCRRASSPSCFHPASLVRYFISLHELHSDTRQYVHFPNEISIVAFTCRLRRDPITPRRSFFYFALPFCVLAFH